MTSTTRRKPKAIVSEPADKPKAEAVARAVLSPSINAAAVTAEYAKGTFGDQEWGPLIDSLSESVKDVQAGDMRRVEAMLFAQATALQSIFTTFARRSCAQEYMRQMETYLRLALKAQSQCRATLETLATVKAGPAIFARQANIAHGPQQVNNGVSRPVRAGARAGETESAKTELLEAPAFGQHTSNTWQPDSSGAPSTLSARDEEGKL